MKPPWYGRLYPSLRSLEGYAESLGAGVGYAAIPFALYHPNVDGVPVILLPADYGPLARCWGLAHELGHLVRHAGPRGHLLYRKDERTADCWAARALIPEAAVRRYRNASMDAFIAALWRHYEEFPMEDCPTRALAGRIARVRLGCLEATG